MKVLVVGGGAREHALAWRLVHEQPGTEIIAAPGNPGLAAMGRCVAIAATHIGKLVTLAETERPAYTIVGPETPLALGIVDRFQSHGLPIFGPTQAAAAIEASKVFAKDVMRDAGVPTGRAERHTDAAAAKKAATAFGPRVVIKASGLAAGKGVIVAHSAEAAHRAIDEMLIARSLGEAGREILIEEFLDGEEVSVFGVTDGTRIIPLIPAQDHKRLLEGDRGPNTGGMGAYAPFAGPDATPFAQRIADTIMQPVLAELRRRNCPFTGLLYAGLMLTPDGPMVVEFNCRFGDPETEAILPITGMELEPLLHAVAVGDSLPDHVADAGPSGHAVTTVLAASGYPTAPRTGDTIHLPPPEPGIHVFHAGTARSATGELVTWGGRVLAVTAVADTLADARRQSTAYAGRIAFTGKQYRTDIGARAQRHDARAP